LKSGALSPGCSSGPSRDVVFPENLTVLAATVNFRSS
jgi:hypothetical protein